MVNEATLNAVKMYSSKKNYHIIAMCHLDNIFLYILFSVVKATNQLYDALHIITLHGNISIYSFFYQQQCF